METVNDTRNAERQHLYSFNNPADAYYDMRNRFKIESNTLSD